MPIYHVIKYMKMPILQGIRDMDGNDWEERRERVDHLIQVASTFTQTPWTRDKVQHIQDLNNRI